MKGPVTDVRPAASRSLRGRLVSLLPAAVDGRVRVVAWLSLVFEIIIVGTGGAVRLTGSGLGCPTWPRCTDGSFVATPEQGLHGVIEFGNRLLTFVIVAIVLITVLAVVRYRRERRDLFRLAVAIAAGIPAQAVLGGISVLTGLNPYVVGGHFVLSIVLVVLATVFLYRVLTGPVAPGWATPPWFASLAWAAALLTGLAVMFGVLTTGSGPHAGDAATPRNGLDSEVLQHLHSYPAYLLLAVTVVLTVAALRLRLRRVRMLVGLLLAVEVLQIVVGVTQARLGLPILLVGVHMVLACILTATMTSVVLSLRGAPAVRRSAAIVERERATAAR